MRLAARPRAGMSLMMAGLVLNIDTFRGESVAQLFRNGILHRHETRYSAFSVNVKCATRRRGNGAEVKT
jgi:hypothetical protein